MSENFGGNPPFKETPIYSINIRSIHITVAPQHRCHILQVPPGFCLTSENFRRVRSKLVYEKSIRKSTAKPKFKENISIINYLSFQTLFWGALKCLCIFCGVGKIREANHYSHSVSDGIWGAKKNLFRRPK